jgi:ketosteroid isomerase-like protein
MGGRGTDEVSAIKGRYEMNSHNAWEPAPNPEDLARFFIVRANAGDVDGLVNLYEPVALLAGLAGQVMRGHDAIRRFYAQLLADRPTFQAGKQRPALRRGDLALTSSRLLNGMVTAEVARQQPDGTWLWAIDQPAIARETPLGDFQ